MAKAIEQMQQEVKQLQQKIKAQKKAESAAKKMALGEGIQRAIKAGDLQWHDIKKLLKIHVKNKQHRALLALDEEVSEKTEVSSVVNSPDAV